MTPEQRAVLQALESSGRPWTPGGGVRAQPSGTRPIPERLGMLGNAMGLIRGNPLEWLLPFHGTLEAWGNNQQPSYLDNLGSALEMAPGIGKAASAGLAGGALLGRMAVGGVDDAVRAAGPLGRQLGIMGGQKAATADLGLLEIAMDAEKRGLPKERIMDATGWFKGADGQWRFELDDSAMQYSPQKMEPFDTPGGDVFIGDLGESVGHPALFAAYPDLANVSSIHRPGYSETLGSYRAPGPLGGESITTRMFPKKDTALHEVQHGVQQREGFARGGSPDMFRTPENLMEQIGRDLDVLDDAREIRRLMDKRGLSPKEAEVAYGELLAARGESRSPLPGARVEAGLNPFDELNRLFNIGKRDLAERLDNNMLAWEKYQRLAGEVEARNVQNRLGLLADDRRMLYPWLTEDDQEIQQIVRFK